MGRAGRRGRYGALTALSGIAVLVAASTSLPSIEPTCSVQESESTVFSRSASELFGGGPVVPGERRTASFEVRNTREQPVVMTVRATDIRIPEAFARAGTSLTVSVADRIEQTHTLPSVAPDVAMSPGQQLLPGEIAAVRVDLQIGDLRGTEGQGAPMSFQIEVGFDEPSATGKPEGSCHRFSHSELERARTHSQNPLQTPTDSRNEA